MDRRWWIPFADKLRDVIGNRPVCADKTAGLWDHVEVEMTQASGECRESYF
jgi:hypothetical protein